MNLPDLSTGSRAVALRCLTPLCCLLLVLAFGSGCGGDDDDSTPPAPVCGNGVIEGAEECDDGNMEDGDGCSAECIIEEGFECEGEPSVCTAVGESTVDPTSQPVCGNGVIEGDQECDDGNTVSGDGCSADCTVEQGYQCLGEPSVCTLVEGPCAGVDCSGFESLCTEGRCNPATGQCEAAPINEGGDCSAQDLCLEGATCTQGQCLGQRRDCSEFSGACSDGRCNAATGECEAQPINENSDCSDPELPCQAGTCQAGTCEFEDLDDGTDCSDPEAECVVGTCDGGQCGFENVADETECGDPAVCEVGLCRDGECSIEPAEELSPCDAEECSEGACVAGECVVTQLPDCSACGEDGESLCAGGICGGVGGEQVWDFADGEVPDAFEMEGNLAWTVVTDGDAVGGFALASDGPDPSQPSITRVTVTLNQAGSVTFNRQIEVDLLGGFIGTNTLQFLVNGTEVESWTGDTAWGETTHALEAGENVLEWRFVFSAMFPIGSGGKAAIDNVRVEGVPVGCSDDCGDAIWDGEECIVCSPVADGTECGGDDECSGGTCQDGACISEVVDGGVCGPVDNPCVAGVCDDGDCVVEDVADDTPCPVDETNTCVVGTCQSGTCEPVTLDDGDPCGDSENPCQTGICDDGQCMLTNVNDDTPCGDPGICESGLCSEGECVVAPVADDTPCPADECNAGLCVGGACQVEPLADCTPCGEDDAQACAAGVCGGPTTASQTWDFADGTLPEALVTEGDAPWTVEEEASAEGGNALRSGAPDVGEASSVSLTVEVGEDASAQFSVLLEGAFLEGETENAILVLDIDGEEAERWVTSQPWQEVEVELDAGTRTLTWRLELLEDVQEDFPTAWIDNLRLFGLTPPVCEATDACDLGVFDGETCLICEDFDPACE